MAGVSAHVLAPEFRSAAADSAVMKFINFSSDATYGGKMIDVLHSGNSRSRSDVADEMEKAFCSDCQPV